MKTQSNRKPTTAAQQAKKAVARTSATKTPSRTRAAKTTPSLSNVKPHTTKLAAILDLLKRPGGATLNDLSTVTGWQAHSIRGCLSGTIKKKLALKLSSEKTDTGRVYRVAA